MKSPLRPQTFARVCLAFTLLLVQIGCAEEPASPPTPAVVEKPAEEFAGSGTVWLDPEKLFRGDALRLEPHLGLTGGCFRLRYAGPKTHLTCIWEIWQQGEFKRVCAGADFGLPSPASHELTFSIREDADHPGSTHRIVTALDSSCSMGSVDLGRLPEDAGWTVRFLERRIEFGDDEEPAVWAVWGNRHRGISMTDSVEDVARSAEWALLLRIKLE